MAGMTAIRAITGIMKISFLIHHGYGIGGTIRTTFNLAEALAPRHDVEIVSVFRHRAAPLFALDPRVRLRHLVDMRKNASDRTDDEPLRHRPSAVFPSGDGLFRLYSGLTDQRIGDWLRELDADVVIGTRPGLNVQLAAQAPRRLIRIAQEHLMFDAHPMRLKFQLRRSYPRMDAVTTVTEADADHYRHQLCLSGVRVAAVPNAVPAPPLAPSDTTAPLVVAAGRLVPVKQYALLIDAFAEVAAARPDWQLRIYGAGPERARLRRLIEQRKLYNHVYLMGAHTPLDTELVKGSIAVSTSRLEAFGMSIVEAMRCGLPMVSTACPLGPLEIIRDGVDGRLVRPGDPQAVADALLQLIADDALRQRMGHAATARAARYDPSAIAVRFEELLHDIAVDRHSTSRTRRTVQQGISTLVTAPYTLADLRRAVPRHTRSRLAQLRNSPRPSS